MSKERTPTSYLTDDWSGTPPGGTNASGVEEHGDGNDNSGNPMRWDLPPSPEWGWNEKEGKMTSYGHSDDVEDTGTRSSAWNMSKEEIAKGFEPAERYDDGQHHQDIPATNEWDRGAGSEPRAREFSSTEGREFTGVGHSKNRSGLGSMTIKPGNQAD
jgi:hypothetical protein